MISALITGSIVSDPKSGTSKSGVEWSNCVVRCPCGQNRETGDQESAFVQVAAFGSEAAKLARLTKGDSVSASGALKPTTYTKDGQERHGLSLNATGILTTYQIKRRRGDDGRVKREHVHDSDREANRAYDRFARQVTGKSAPEDFNDELSF